jgi:hypothetical protein
MHGNLDDFGALSPSDSPNRNVFLDGCNRIATHGLRVRGIAPSESILRQNA